MRNDIDGQQKTGHRVPRIAPHEPPTRTPCDAWTPEHWRAWIERKNTDPEFAAKVKQAQDERLVVYTEELEAAKERNMPLQRGQWIILSRAAHRRALARVPRPNPMEDGR